MRLFMALEFDDACNDAIIEIAGRLQKMVSRGRFTSRDNLHLTLDFLGEVDPSRIRELYRIVDETSVPPLTLVFEKTGCFRRRKGGDIFWLGIRRNTALSELQADLTRRLLAAGFTPCDQGFTPHITLARSVHYDRFPELDGLPERPFETRCDRIHLMQSTRRDDRLVYLSLHESAGGRP